MVSDEFLKQRETEAFLKFNGCFLTEFAPEKHIHLRIAAVTLPRCVRRFDTCLPKWPSFGPLTNFQLLTLSYPGGGEYAPPLVLPPPSQNGSKYQAETF